VLDSLKLALEVFQDNDWNGQRPATRKGFVRMLALCEDTRKEKKRCVFHQTPVLEILEVISRDSRIASFIGRTSKVMIPMIACSSRESVSFLNCHFFVI
jgi:hypothetical protein